MRRLVCAAIPAATLLLYSASPALADAGMINSITRAYQNAGQGIANTLQTYAVALFWSLAAIQFAGSSIRLGLQGADMQEWAAHIVRQILFIGIYAWLMTNAYTFSLDIVNSFRQAGAAAAGGSGMQPANIFSIGLKIADSVSRMATIWNPFNGALLALCSVAIVVCFGWVTALVVVAVCEMYILIGAGVLLMGFGGSEWTRDFANKNLLLAVSIGAKLLIMQVIIGAGMNIMQSWANYPYADNQSVFSVLAAVVVFVLIVLQLPNLAQQFIAGAASGSTAAGAIRGLTTAVASAALAATGGGAALMAARQAAEAIGGGGGGAGGGLPGLGGSEGGGPAGAAGGGATAATFGGSSGGGVGGGAFTTPAASAGASLGQIGRALSRGVNAEMRGRITGVGIKGGTTGGRIAAYIRDPSLGQQQASYPPPPSHSGNEISGSPNDGSNT